MNPMERANYEREGWEPRTRLFGPHGEYIYSGAYSGAGSSPTRYRYAYGTYEPRFEHFYERYGSFRPTGEHHWRGGILGWLGSGLRAGAAWFGGQMQRWGTVFGGKLQGTSEEIGQAMRAQGERMGSAMEDRGQEVSQRFPAWQARPARSYRRPDDRILDDVHQRIAASDVDAEEVEIEVNHGVVTMSGRVPRRVDKRVIEEIAEQVFGVDEVQNHLRLARGLEQDRSGGKAGATGAENGHGASYGSGSEGRQ